MEKIHNHINNLKKELFLLEKYVENNKDNKKSIKFNLKLKPAGHITPIINKTNINFQNSLRN